MVANATPLAGLHCIVHAFAADDTAPTAGTAFGEITSIGDLAITRDIAEWHEHQDDWMKKLATLLSVDDVEIEAVFIGADTDQIAIRTAFLSGAAGNYGITYAPKNSYVDGTLARFSAIVATYARMSPQDDKVMIKFSFAITGELQEETLVMPPVMPPGQNENTGG